MSGKNRLEQAPVGADRHHCVCASRRVPSAMFLMCCSRAPTTCSRGRYNQAFAYFLGQLSMKTIQYVGAAVKRHAAFAVLPMIFIHALPSALAEGRASLAPAAQNSPAVETELTIPPVHKKLAMPAFPQVERDAKHHGYVDIEMLISAEGRLLEIKSLKAEPANPAFEEAVRDAAPKWEFAPGARHCVPQTSLASYRIFFEDEAAKESVRALQILPKAQAEYLRTRMKPANEREAFGGLRYPLDARRANARGNVQLLLTVNPADGEVSNIAVAHAVSNKEGFEKKFAESAMAVARKLKFAAAPALNGPQSICMPFDFKLE